MGQSLTMSGPVWRRGIAAALGLGMAIASFMTVQHFFAANYPETIWEGSFCDVSAFFNCDSSAFSIISAVWGIPIGFFGILMGVLVCLGVLFPSPSFERTNKGLALLNILGVVALLIYSVIVLGSICLLCTGYYAFSGLNLFLFWRYRIDYESDNFLSRYVQPASKLLATVFVIAIVGGAGVIEYHTVRKDAQTGGVASNIVAQFFELPEVPLPSTLSPFWSERSSEAFEDAPIQIVEFADLLCSDCLILHKQLKRLSKEFEGKMNIAFQLFPLESRCNDVVEKDLHPGACDLSLMVAYDEQKFNTLREEIFDNFRAAKTPEWREDFARRHQVEAAVADSATNALLKTLIKTGTEYAKTSEEYEFGIRSTPTLIINNRLIIGTFPDAQMRAIFRAILDQEEGAEKPEFIENWVD